MFAIVYWSGKEGSSDSHTSQCISATTITIIIAIIMAAT